MKSGKKKGKKDKKIKVVSKNKGLEIFFLNLSDNEFKIDRRELNVTEVESFEELEEKIKNQNEDNFCVILGISSNLMVNYVVISSILYSSNRGSTFPIINIIHPSRDFKEYRAFVYGIKPYPVKILNKDTLNTLLNIKNVNMRTFDRIPVEFIAFIEGEKIKKTFPVVCKNVSWSGAYLETKIRIDAEEFDLVLKSRLHNIPIPSQKIREIEIEEHPKRFGYGIKFKFPLPLTLIQYLYTKYLREKENKDVQ